MPSAGAGAVPAQPAVPPAGQQVAAAPPAMDPNAAYRAHVVQLRERLGPVPSVFRQANLPELPVEAGRWNYNPFTGLMLKG